MKSSLPTKTLLALFAMSLMVMAVSSSGLRGRALQSISVTGSNLSAPSIKISGVSQLLQILKSASAFTDSDFDVLTIDSFSESVSDQGVSIEGKVTLANDQGVNVSGLISGTWDPVNNNIAFTATKYEVDNEDSDEGDSDAGDDNGDNGDNSTTTSDGYTIVPIEVAQNDTNISAALNFGVQAVIETGERQNKIPLSDYAVTEWISAAYKQKSNGIYYKFVAKLLGANYVHVDVNVTTFVSTNQNYSVFSYHFHAYNITKGSLPNNFTDDDNNNTTTTPPVPVPEAYTWISPEDLANNTIAQGALSWGVDTLVAKAISQYKLPAADAEYNVTNLILAANKTTGYGTAYIFWTNLTNDLGYKMDANITIKYWKSNQNYTLAGYSFHSYGYPSSAIVIPPPANDTNNTNNATDNSTTPSNATVPDNSTVVDNSTVPDNSTVVDNSTVIDPNNSTQPADNSTVIVPDNSTVVDNSTTNDTQPILSTPPPVVNLTSDGYTIFTADQLAQDSSAQAALQFGVNALVQKIIGQNKLPAAHPDYTVNNINLAAYKKVVIGTYYKFQVNATNVDLVHLDANLTIFYRYSTKALSLNGYSFHSYNYSAKALNNNNGKDNGNDNNGKPNATIPAANDTNPSVPAANNTDSSSNSTVIDPNNSTQPADNSTVIVPDNSTVVDNSTVIDPSAPVSGDNSTVVDPSAPVSGDNSTVIDPSAPVSGDNSTVVDPTLSGSR